MGTNLRWEQRPFVYSKDGMTVNLSEEVVMLTYTGDDRGAYGWDSNPNRLPFVRGATTKLTQC